MLRSMVLALRNILAGSVARTQLLGALRALVGERQLVIVHGEQAGHLELVCLGVEVLVVNAGRWLGRPDERPADPDVLAEDRLGKFCRV